MILPTQQFEMINLRQKDKRAMKLQFNKILSRLVTSIKGILTSNTIFFNNKNPNMTLW